MAKDNRLLLCVIERIVGILGGFFEQRLDSFLEAVGLPIFRRLRRNVSATRYLLQLLRLWSLY